MISQKKFIAISLAFFVLALFMNKANAQISDSLKTQLQRVSSEMCEEGNNNFIVVDAIIDGYISLRAKYSFVYKKDMILINDAPLMPSDYPRYSEK